MRYFSGWPNDAINIAHKGSKEGFDIVKCLGHDGNEQKGPTTTPGGSDGRSVDKAQSDVTVQVGSDEGQTSGRDNVAVNDMERPEGG